MMSRRRARESALETAIGHYARSALLLSAAGLAGAQLASAEPTDAEPASQPVQRSFVGSVVRNTTDLLLAELGALGDVGVVLVLLGFTVLTIYIVPPVFEGILRRFEAPAHVRQITRSVLHLAIGYLGIRLALGAIGVDADGLILSFGLVSVALSIGAASAIANVVAGLVHTSDEMQPGGRIAIHTYTGVVVAHGLFNVRLNDDETSTIVVIPNVDFINYAWRALPPQKEASLETDDEVDAKTIGRFINNKNQ